MYRGKAVQDSDVRVKDDSGARLSKKRNKAPPNRKSEGTERHTDTEANKN